MNPFILIIIFLGATILGYKLIGNVPSLLHTPLMSGMNALSGMTVLGALAITAIAITTNQRLLGFLALFLAMLNVAGGFGVTHRMLRMFDKKRGDDHE